jgi:hypothetical protein
MIDRRRLTIDFYATVTLAVDPEAVPAADVDPSP